ncbi:GFA family protein [Tardiphaga robiniae]|uniref:Aldehyde-activating protein n=1 Tax=Tardiphaga robiniae TaxID=943830 RepID=A0A163Z0X8_9BRAD|nr:GFA family protein [Tardiphaga robiniae]KZD22788.1 aldehyde-activating protein [Tardiphaga robiniae]
MSTYVGGCQCGKVRYEMTGEIAEVIACNCSRCGKLGTLLTFVPAQNFKLLSGEDATIEFLFNKNVIHHRFCATCGVESFANGKAPNGSEMVAVNVRCIDGIDLDGLQVKQFDGKKY